MSREGDMALIEFCAEQFEHFEPAAWLGFERVSRETLAAAAMFLALGVKDWAGRRESLEAVAEALAPGREFTELLRMTRFDFARFRSQLAVRLTHACPLS